MANWQPPLRTHPNTMSGPVAHEPERGNKALSALELWAADNVDTDVSLLQDPAIRALIVSVAGNSPFLGGLIARDPAFAARVFCEDGDTLLAALLSDLRTDGPLLRDTPALMDALRTAKASIALLTAVMDIAGIWTLDQVTDALSEFAELALDLAVARLLHDRMAKGELAWPNGEETDPSPDLAAGSGFAVIAMGKLGGSELNYSSDIDLILVYDEEADVYRGRRSLSDCYVKLAQDLVKVMEQRTACGYVFRTDLRLRPDPGATPLVISLNAAETYYQSQGRTWERSAMIKARVVAGDRAAGADFLERIRPFVWRRSLDFAAIRDIHDIKSRVHEHHRHTDIAVGGQDVKLGRGGIREIEFAAQIHQLIAGGRETSLRTRATLPTLAAIRDLGRMSADDEGALRTAYYFLRTVEHRLQMIADEQTHTIPDDPDGIAHLAHFMGFNDSKQFEAELLGHLSAVREIYEGVLGDTDVSESSDDRDAPAPALPDEAIAANLAELGYGATETGAEIVALWRTGRYRALRTERARGLLEICLGDLLGALGKASDPDQALTRFDTFLSKLPAGVQIFSLLQANTWLFSLLAKIMGSAPALAEHLARKPEMLDAVLDPGFFSPLPDEDALRDSLSAMLGLSRDYQDTLDLTRRWLGDMRFQVGVQILEGLIDVTEAGAALALLADVTITELIPRVEDDFAIRHGRFPGGDLAVVAMGSYGGRGITYTSDLDIIFLYDADFDVEASDGEKPLSPSLYFSRLGQHVITAITVLTGEGRLYEIDLRLRPSGSKGPLVVTLKTFDDYQQQSAWTWEHMALTRARIVRASAKFAGAVQDSIRATLTMERDTHALTTNVADMRVRLDKEFGTDNPWAVKYVRGGIIDAEFIVQYLLLREGPAHADIFAPELNDAISNLCRLDALSATDGEELKSAVKLMRTVQGLLRLCFSGATSEEAFSDNLRQLLAEQSGCGSFEALKSQLEAAQTFVYALYARLLGDQEQGMKDGD